MVGMAAETAVVVLAAGGRLAAERLRWGKLGGTRWLGVWG